VRGGNGSGNTLDLWIVDRSAVESESVGTPRIDVRGLGAGVVPVPTPQLWEVPTMSESMALVGLDVHQAQSVAAVLDPSSGELRVERLRGAPAAVVPEFLEALGRPVRAVYEAGPTGFGLARAGAAAGELSFVFVPSEEDERFRDLVRCIDDARKDMMRARHRLSKFLLRRVERFHGCAWTQTHERWLRTLSFDHALTRATFIDYWSAVQALVARRAAFDRGARAGRAREQSRSGDRALALLPRDRHAVGTTSSFSRRWRPTPIEPCPTGTGSGPPPDRVPAMRRVFGGAALVIAGIAAFIEAHRSTNRYQPKQRHPSPWKGTCTKRPDRPSTATDHRASPIRPTTCSASAGGHSSSSGRYWSPSVWSATGAPRRGGTCLSLRLVRTCAAPVRQPQAGDGSCAPPAGGGKDRGRRATSVPLRPRGKAASDSLRLTGGTRDRPLRDMEVGG
jgi:hypothetical protein